MLFRALMPMAVLVFLAQPAGAGPAIEEAYEVSVTDLTLPSNEFGRVTLRECASCDVASHRVDGATRYFFDGRQMGLQDFLVAVAGMDRHGEASAAVIYRLDSGKVSRVFVYPAPDPN